MATDRFRNVCGKLIRQKRIEAGWTQDELAAKLQLAGLPQLDRVAVAKIESQFRSVFDYEIVVLANIFGCTQSEILPDVKAVKRSLELLCRQKGD